MHRSCATAAGRVTIITPASLRWAPHIGSTAWTMATTRAITRAKCPNSTIILCPSWCRGAPFPVLLQGRGDLGGHVFLVMLGQHAAGGETAVGGQAAFDHDALAFAEKVGQNAAIDHQQCVLLVGDAKANGGSVLRHTALLHQPAEAEALAHRLGLGQQIGGAVEEDDILVEGK